jgi:hypothetical protein
VVLLSSHFERYIYAVNEEAAARVNAVSPRGTDLPEPLRLVHSRLAVDSLAQTGWENRTGALEAFVRSDGWLWGSQAWGALDHKPLLVWMKSPTPKNLIRYYAYWGIGDIFTAITRRPHTRSNLQLRLGDLVQKRNNIAHGDPTVDATRADLIEFENAVRVFCDRADAQMARQLGRLLHNPPVW